MWPRGPTKWIEGRLLRVSIPFTWNLPKVRAMLMQRSFLWDRAEVGGPAVELMPNFLNGMDWVEIGHECPNVLERINPRATRTTLGCTRRCRFCAIGEGRIDGEFTELADWPDKPVLCDNNLLAASDRHVERVLARLIDLGEADFNQGLDARLLTDDHAAMIARIKAPIVRLAMDHMGMADEWDGAFDRLRSAGIAKKKIRSYCLVGFKTDPTEAWQRCEWVERHGVKAYPMWFHPLDALEYNAVTDEQQALGWSKEAQAHIMGYYYQHRGQVPLPQAC